MEAVVAAFFGLASIPAFFTIFFFAVTLTENSDYLFMDHRRPVSHGCPGQKRGGL